MIVAGQASLWVSSKTRRVVDVGPLLDLEPTSSWEHGDRITHITTEERYRVNSHWVFRVESIPDEDGSEGTPWLERLIDILEPRRERLALLTQDYSAHIHWTAEFDSSQWSLEIQPELVVRLGALGLPVSFRADEIDE